MTPLEHCIRASCENVPPCDYPTCGCEFEPTRIKVAIAAALADDEAAVEAMARAIHPSVDRETIAASYRALAALRRHILGEA